MTDTFEDDLIDFVDRHREAGVSMDEIISVMELRLMALKEETAGDD